LPQSILVRPARPDDAPHILKIIRQLAAFEGAPDGVRLTEEVFRADGFGPDRRFEVLLAEMDQRPCGAATLYQAYSSWQGAPTLVVHDLFVEEPMRGAGVGRALLKEAARLARQRGCCRMDVNVLARNRAARRFYAELGFAHLEGWLPYRLTGRGLAKLAGEDN
jgi:GNAT superfamily N-acetyltransferase